MGESLWCKMRRVNWQAGFTLLEVLIALAMLAIALAAAMRVAGVSTDTSFQVKQRVIAHWIAENRLAELRVGVWPTVGKNQGDSEQAGVRLSWEETISGTPNPNFRRVEIRVFAAAQPDYAYADLVAYLPSQR